MVVDSRNLKLLDADRKEIELGRDSKVSSIIKQWLIFWLLITLFAK